MNRPTTSISTASTGSTLPVPLSSSLIVISHDRHFLNEVCTHIADIDYETIIPYPGNYDDMVEAKLAVRGRVEADHEQRLERSASQRLHSALPRRLAQARRKP